MAVNSFREDEYMENTDKKKILSRLLSYLLDYKLAIAGVLVCMGITVGISLVNPLLIEEAIDHYIAQSDFKGLIALGIFALALNVLFIILVKVRMYSMSVISNKILLKIRQDLYEHIQTLSFSFFDSRPTGKILARIIGDVNSLKDVLVNVVNQRLVQLQLLLNLVITLEQLDGVPTQEAVINLALDGLFDMSDGMLNAASEHMGQLASLARLCSGNSHLSSLHAAFALQCADLNSLAAQLCAELLQVDLITILADQVDHVDGHNHRNAQLNQLGGQVQVTFNVGTINDIQDGIRLFIDQVTTGHNFLQGVGGQGVDTGQVLNDNVLLTFQAAFLLFNRNAGPVADILVRTG